MTDRYQLAALADAMPHCVSALAPVASLADSASDRLAALSARIAVTPDPIDQVVVTVAAIRDLGAAGAGAFADWIAAASAIAGIPSPSLSPSLTRAQDLAHAAAKLIAAACWQEAAVAAVSSPPAFRDGVETMRATLTAGVEPVLDDLAAMGALEAHAAVERTISLAVAGLDDIALAIAPLAELRTSRSLPAPVLAWTLYGDVERCTDLVARAATLTPLFMPTELTVPAPTAI